MKPAAIFLALSLGAAFSALAADMPAPAKSANVCLDASFVDHTSVISDREILFYMKNRKIWKNTLKSTCPGLDFENGFSEEIRGDSICSNMQTIFVLRRGTPCSLGEFTAYTPPPKASAP